jgi:5'-phosphate synthase pdxT subunit
MYISSLNYPFTLQVVLELTPSPADPPIEVIAQLSPDLLPTALSTLHSDDPKTFVAMRQGRHFLTTFHPELTDDNRFHEYFIKECVIGPR